MKYNSIIVEGLFGNVLKSYDDVKLGQNVKALLKYSTSHGNDIHWKELNLHNIMDQYVMVVTTLTTIHPLVGSVNIMEGSDAGREFNDKSVLSEFILLAIIQASNKNATS